MPALTFKGSPAEARVIRGKARAERVTVFAFLRTRALATPPARREIILKKHPVSGLLDDSGGVGGPMVTREQIKAAPADFP